jgi:Skp family chaperone for outer membrane proteins
MMKKSILALLALFAVAATASAELKIVTVNVQQCFDGYYKSADFNERMSSVMENFRNQARERQTSLQEEAAPLEQKVQEIRENPGLSDEAKQTQLQAMQPEIQAFQTKQQDFERWVQEERQKAQQQQLNLRKTLIDDIKRVAIDVGVKDGADLVLDTSDITQSGVPTVLYATTSIDITNRVLNELNRDAPTN